MAGFTEIHQHMVFYGNTMTLKSCEELIVFSAVGAPGEEIDHRPLTWCTVVTDCSCPLFTVSSCEGDFFFFFWSERNEQFATLLHTFPALLSIHLSARSLENFPWLQVLVLRFCFATGGKVHGHTIWTLLAYFSLWSSKSVLELSVMEIIVNIVH